MFHRTWNAKSRFLIREKAFLGHFKQSEFPLNEFAFQANDKNDFQCVGSRSKCEKNWSTFKTRP
jgi:hypothetical protein